MFSRPPTCASVLSGHRDSLLKDRITIHNVYAPATPRRRTYDLSANEKRRICSVSILPSRSLPFHAAAHPRYAPTRASYYLSGSPQIGRPCLAEPPVVRSPLVNDVLDAWKEVKELEDKLKEAGVASVELPERLRTFE